MSWTDLISIDITVDSLSREALDILHEPFLPDALVRYCEHASRSGMCFDEWAREHGFVEIDLFEGDEP